MQFCYCVLLQFTATDGTTFEDRNAWRKYEFETNYTFRNTHKQLLVKAPGKIGGCVRPLCLDHFDYEVEV